MSNPSYVQSLNVNFSNKKEEVVQLTTNPNVVVLWYAMSEADKANLALLAAANGDTFPLPSLDLAKTTIVGNGQSWWETYKGMCKTIPTNLTSTSGSAADGLSSTTIAQIQSLVSGDGTALLTAAQVSANATNFIASKDDGTPIKPDGMVLSVGGALEATFTQLVASLVFGAVGTAYFVDSVNGSDGNSGTSDISAWKTLAKVNAATFAPGDLVLFRAGQTFSGTSLIPQSGRKDRQLTYASWGGNGRAVLSTTADGLKVTTQSYLTVRDINFVGPGNTHASKVDGLSLDAGAVATGPVMLPGLQLINLDVSQYPSTGVLMTSTSSTYNPCGFSDFLLHNVIVHDCSGNARDHGNGGGICVAVTGAFYGYGLKSFKPSFVNGRISNCYAYGCQGTAGVTNSGQGILVTECQNVSVEYSHVTNCGSNTTGSGGIWMGECIGTWIRYCEVDSMHSSGPTDGAGFDIDGGCVGCGIEFCYAHDCDGGGFYIYNYSDSAINTPVSNVIRYCISVNNGRNAAVNTHAQLLFANDGVAGNIWDAYNNTLVTNVAGTSCLAFGGSTIAGTTIRFANNILMTSSTSLKLIDCVGGVTPSAATLVNNLYWSGSVGNGSIKWGGATYSTISAWQTATGQEKISGTSKYLNADPLFVNPFVTLSTGPRGLGALATVFSSKGANSAIVGAGLNLTTQYSINTGGKDFIGTASPLRGLTPCVGAIEA